MVRAYQAHDMVDVLDDALERRTRNIRPGTLDIPDIVLPRHSVGIGRAFLHPFIQLSRGILPPCLHLVVILLVQEVRSVSNSNYASVLCQSANHVVRDISWMVDQSP